MRPNTTTFLSCSQARPLFVPRAYSTNSAPQPAFPLFQNPGAHAVTDSLRLWGYSGAHQDLLHHQKNYDLLNARGIIMAFAALRWVNFPDCACCAASTVSCAYALLGSMADGMPVSAQVRPRGLLHIGPPCSSWVWLSCPQLPAAHFGASNMNMDRLCCTKPRARQCLVSMQVARNYWTFCQQPGRQRGLPGSPQPEPTGQKSHSHLTGPYSLDLRLAARG